MKDLRLPPWFKLLTVFSAVGTLILLYGDGLKPDRLPRPQSIEVVARAIPIPTGNVDIPTALSLKLTNAWELTSVSEDFGGISAMHASGNSLTLISDKGALIRLGKADARRWRGVSTALPPQCGDMADKHQRDTESLVTDKRSGAIWVGFEYRNALCRMSAAGTSVISPPAMRNWLKVGGPEAMARLKRGAFLIFQERSRRDDGLTELLYFANDPFAPGTVPVKMLYRAPSGYAPTDAAELPDGRVLVLNRRFSFPFNFSAKLSIVTLPPPAPDALVEGPIMARIAGDGLGENYEALSIDDDGRDLVIWMASDSNFFAIQRTLLLRFIWPGAARLEADAASR